MKLPAHVGSIKLVLIFQKALQSNIIILTDLQRNELYDFTQEPFHSHRKKRELTYSTFVVQTLMSTSGKGMVGIWNS